MKYKIRVAKIEMDGIVDIPEGAIPFQVEMPHAYYGDGAKKPAVSFPGAIYCLFPIKDEVKE